MGVPPRWWSAAERKLSDTRKAEEYFRKLLNLHPNPKNLLSYLNERRFILLLEILEGSQCLRNFLFRHPEEFERVIPGLWYVSKEKKEYLSELTSMVSDGDTDEKFSEKLAYYRHRELMRIFAKEILGTAKIEDILREYSFLPDAMLELSYRRALGLVEERYGKPGKVSGVVIALGKYGSEELNYYSDIDLLFIHSEDGGNEFFSQVFKKTVALMSAQTPEGKPYEVDLGLRPFGKTGPISMSLRSAELYYESYGRIWERFALLRARPVAGDVELGERFMREVVTPFVYAPSDYRLVEEIKLMKKRIEAFSRKGILTGYDVKSGEGGIREVEFTVQSLIILLGNKSKFLRERNTFRGIWKLNRKGVFSDEEALFLERAYSFLRKLEHRIQLKRCVQTQKMDEGDVPFLSKALGLSESAFLRELESVRSCVREVFTGLVPGRREREMEPIQIALMTEDTDFGSYLLKERGFKNPRSSFTLLINCAGISDKERERFLDIVPRVVELAESSSEPDETLRNFEKFFLNPTGRKVVLSEPKEDFLGGLFRVFSLSPALSSLISKNPDLVEDVLTLYRRYPDPEELEEEFERWKRSLDLSPENLFRRFKKVWEIRIGLVYLMGRRGDENLRSLFKALSLLAEFLLHRLWEEVSLGSERAVLYSLGKLGSRELSFGSDLDLVFCSSAPSENINKKARALVRFITTHTSEGYLYDVDFRLRPMGSMGELVPALDFYRKYLRENARTWERLAWTRARFITGEDELRESLEKEIEGFLFGGPWGERERREVCEMRLKLQDLAKRDRGVVDIKFGIGGMLDGEFLVQYLLIKEGIRERSIIDGFERLKTLYPSLGDAFNAFMFLRLVETHLRLIKERASSVLDSRTMPKVALSLGMDEGEFEEELKKNMKSLREVFLEFIGDLPA